MHAERFESALWQTSSLLLAKDGEAVLVDPGISSEEVGRIAARADELGVRVVAVLATHADWDHVCGFAAFPDAEATVGEASAERIESGGAWARIREAAAEYGLEVPGPPRVDRRLEVGRAHRVGPFTVEAIPLPGHTHDGVGFRIRELDLLAVGDHLSAIEFPFASSPAAYRATLAGLIDLLRRDPPAPWSSGMDPSTLRTRLGRSPRPISTTSGACTTPSCAGASRPSRRAPARTTWRRCSARTPRRSARSSASSARRRAAAARGSPSHGRR